MLFLLSFSAMPAAAMAQGHQHDADPAPAADSRHSGHSGQAPPAPAMDHPQMDHAMMDHSGMDHGAMASDAPIPQGPPPPEAFLGPAHAADAFVGADRMAASRAMIVREMSGMPVFWFQADRAEYRAHEGGDGYLWDIQGYYGGDTDKVWFKSEGEGRFGEKAESAEVQGLWSHAIGPWWDVQAGVRQDLTGPERTHAVIGVQGLAPYLFEEIGRASCRERV